MLELSKLSFSFGNKVVFTEISLQFEKGKTYGIVGANGVGKTTLFRLLASYYRKQSGSIYWEGAPLKQEDVAFLPTDPFFYPYMNGLEYLKIVLHTNKEHLLKAVELASMLHLPLDQLVDGYSTGMKKKLAFVACQNLDRAVNILDEPFSGVDLESNERLVALMAQKPADKVVLISSHILTMMNELCDEIFYIQKGFEVARYLPAEYEALREKIKASL